MCSVEKVTQVFSFLGLIIILGFFVLLKADMDIHINELVIWSGGWFYIALILIFSFVIYFILDHAFSFIGDSLFGKAFSSDLGNGNLKKIVCLRRGVAFVVAIIVSIDVLSLLASEVYFNEETKTYRFIRLVPDEIIDKERIHRIEGEKLFDEDKKQKDLEPLISSLGTFGDFIGGTLNPLLTFLSFVGVLYTVFLQKNGLEKSECSMSEALKISRYQNSLSLISICLELNSKRVDKVKVVVDLIQPDSFRDKLMKGLVGLDGNKNLSLLLEKGSVLSGEDSFEFLIGIVKVFHHGGIDSAVDIAGKSIGEIAGDKYGMEGISDKCRKEFYSEINRYSGKPFSKVAIEHVVGSVLRDLGCTDVDSKIVESVVDEIHKKYGADLAGIIRVAYPAIAGSSAATFTSYFRSLNSALREISMLQDQDLVNLFSSKMRSEEIVLIALEACVGRSAFSKDLLVQAKELKIFSSVKLRYDNSRDLFYIDDLFPLHYLVISKLFDFNDRKEVVGLGAFGDQESIGVPFLNSLRERYQS